MLNPNQEISFHEGLKNMPPWHLDTLSLGRRKPANEGEGFLFLENQQMKGEGTPLICLKTFSKRNSPVINPLPGSVSQEGLTPLTPKEDRS